MIEWKMGYARNSGSEFPRKGLFDKPFNEWTRKERKWLDAIYERLFPDLSTLPCKSFPGSNQRLYSPRSARGRNSEEMLDKLFFEWAIEKLDKISFDREMKVVMEKSRKPAYREFSKRLANPSFPDNEHGKSMRRDFNNAMKRKFISACQRREKMLRAKR